MNNMLRAGTRWTHRFFVLTPNALLYVIRDDRFLKKDSAVEHARITNSSTLPTAIPYYFER